MKKMILALAIVVFLVPAMLSAGLVNLSVGATAQYGQPFDVLEENEWTEDMGNIENYTFGGELRARVLFAEVNVMALYGSDDVDDLTFSGVVTGGLSLDLLGLVRVGLGLGPRVTAVFPEGQDPQFYAEGVLLGEDFEEALMSTPLTWRATADVKLGNILVGLNYTINSNGFTLESSDYTKLLPASSAWENGRIGASVLYTIF
ncbi:MAG: hypothetical protein JXK93_07995 [Sphaerochaetaceae bacterium]|nr:hypothetical protein [Sphaerochaetaceae bacterium]